MRRALPLLLLSLLAASSAQAQMKPGLWEISAQMSGGGMPAMPKLSAQERKQMESMGIKIPGGGGGPMTMAIKTCVTKEQAEKRLPPQTDEDKRQRCEQKDMKVSGNTTTWKIECNGEQKVTGSGTMTYNGPESYKGESTITTQDPRHGPMTMQQSYSGKWLAANCK
jgi:hypothetical protein